MALLKATTIGCFATLASLASAVDSTTATTTVDYRGDECRDYSEEDPGVVSGVGKGPPDDKCWQHMQWAKKEGLEVYPEWYPPGTQATYADVQCALFLMTIGQNGATENGHGCHHPPCKEISNAMSGNASESDKGNSHTCKKPVLPARDVTMAPVEYTTLSTSPAPIMPITTTTTTAAPGPSIQWWGWVLIVVGVAGLAGGGAIVVMKKPAPKTKRAIAPRSKPVDPAPYVEEAPYVAEAPVSYQPVPTYQNVAPQMSTATYNQYQAPFPTAATPYYGGYGGYGGAPMNSYAQPMGQPF